MRLVKQTAPIVNRAQNGSALSRSEGDARNNSLTTAGFPCNLKRSEGLRHRISDDLRSTGFDQSNRETFGPFGASIQVIELFSLRTHLFSVSYSTAGGSLPSEEVWKRKLVV